jgi:hypothetical protein
MTRMLVATLVWLMVAAHLPAQPQPDFSGTWKRDATRSDSATSPELAGPVTLTIVQKADELQIERETSRGKATDVFRFARADKPTMDGAVARWRGETLVITVLRDIRGQSVSTEQAMTLKVDGKEMLIESTVNVQHGYTSRGSKSSATGRDVYVKVEGAASHGDR